MKLTKSRLKQIIKEELRKALQETGIGMPAPGGATCVCQPEEMKCPSPGIFLPAQPDTPLPWSAVLEGARKDARFGGEPDPESASLYCDNVNWQQGEFQP
jgi:hypothetical protein